VKGSKKMFKKRVSSLIFAAAFSLSLAVGVTAADESKDAQQDDRQSIILDSEKKSVAEDVYSDSKSVQEDVYGISEQNVGQEEEYYTPVVSTPTPTPVKDYVGTITAVNVELDKKPLNIRTINIDGRYYAAIGDLCYYLDVDYKADVNTKMVNIFKGKKTTLKGAEKFTKRSRIDIVRVLPGPYVFKLDSVITGLESYLYAGRSYVPIRFFMEMFDKNIEYIASTNTISISTAQDQIIGSVNGVPLLKKDFDFFYNAQSKEVMDFVAEEELDNELKKLKQEVFDYIVEEALISINMPKTFSVLNDKDYEEINSYINNMIVRYGGIEKFRSVLAEDKVTFYQFMKYTKSSYINSNYLNALIKNVKATDEQLEKYYDDNKKFFVEPETVKAKHILFLLRDQTTGEAYSEEKIKEIENKAKDVLKDIRDGADFDELMDKYGEDPGAKQMPEGYTFSRGEMVKEFEDAAFAMNVGEVSELVKTQYGYHIIKVVDKIPERQILLDEIKDAIRPELDQKAKNDFIEELLDKWKAAGSIVNNMEM